MLHLKRTFYYKILNEELYEEYCYDPPDAAKPLPGVDFYDMHFKGKSEILGPHRSWGIFFKTKFIKDNGLRYLEGVPYLEDGEFMNKVICVASKVIFLPGSIYVQIKRSGSVTTSGIYRTEKARNGFLNSALDLHLFKKDNCKNESQNRFINQSILQFVIVFLISHEGFNYIANYSKIHSSLKLGSLKRIDIDGLSGFYGSMGRSYNHSINCFYLHWYLYKMRISTGIRLRSLLRKITVI